MIVQGQDYSEWTGQFVLSTGRVDIPGWVQRRAFGCYLTTHPSLPIVPVIQNDEEVAVLLGWVISRNGKLLHEWHLSDGDDPVLAAYRNGGRWLLITRTELYVDPSGSQPAVYAPDQRVVASSPGLIDADDDAELVTAFDVVRRDGWYPFGLTPKVGVNRLLPNHKLDLKTFVAERHHEAPAAGSVAVEQAAALALEAVDASGSAFGHTGLFVGLTAVQDSRMLLAGLRKHLNETVFWTARSVARTNPVDIQIAKKLAKRFRLTHEVIERVLTTDAHIRAWLDRVGWTRAGNKAKNHRMEETAGGERPFGTGAIGELARAYYRRDSESDVLDEVEACWFLRAPTIQPVVCAAQKWLKELPVHEKRRSLDLLYLEQRVGCWASPGTISSRREAPTIFLLNRRDVIDGMLALSLEDKRQGRYMNEVIRQGWPELLSIPINRPVGWLAIRTKMSSVPRKVRSRVGALLR